jgi:hypothetical protein
MVYLPWLHLAVPPKRQFQDLVIVPDFALFCARKDVAIVLTEGCSPKVHLEKFSEIPRVCKTW